MILRFLEFYFDFVSKLTICKHKIVIFIMRTQKINLNRNWIKFKDFIIWSWACIYTSNITGVYAMNWEQTWKNTWSCDLGWGKYIYIVEDFWHGYIISFNFEPHFVSDFPQNSFYSLYKMNKEIYLLMH